MKKQDNRPQWLIDAENEIKIFHETKYGSASSKQISDMTNANIARGHIDYDKIKDILSDAGKKGIKSISKEAMSRGGKNSINLPHVKEARDRNNLNEMHKAIQNWKDLVSNLPEKFTRNQIKECGMTEKQISKALSRKVLIDTLEKIGRLTLYSRNY